MGRERKKIVFICHSTEDEVWKDRLDNVLGVLEKEGLLALWDDSRISAGADWKREIDDALSHCGVAVLLVSADFLRSDFIRDHEVPALLRRKQEGALNILPIIVRPSPWREVQWLADLEVLPKGGKPLSELEPPQWESELNDISRSILTLLGPPGGSRRSATDSAWAPARVSDGERPPKAVLGVDIGSTKIAAARFDETFAETRVRRGSPTVQIKRPVTVAKLLGQVTGIVEDLLQQEELSPHDIRGIGVAAPGQVDPRTGTLVFGPGLGVKRVPLANELADKFGCDVRVDNDARCATRFELYCGVGQLGFTDFACVFIGTGVGSGVVIDGKIYNGDTFCAGEIGHTTIDVNGPTCKCGRKGCLEVYVNGPAIARRAQRMAREWSEKGERTVLDPNNADARAVAKAAEKGDAAAQQVASETAVFLAQGLTNYLHILNPGAIVLGGGVMKGLYTHMIDEIERTIRENTLGQVSTNIHRVKSMARAAVVGAALLYHPDEERAH